MSTADASCIGYDFDSSGNVIPIFDEKEENYQKRFIFDAMQKKAMEFIEDITKTFKDDIEKMYYQKYYISLAHEMYVNSAKKIDQDVFYGIDFEDAVGLGENITAINEWNSELEKNNQKRTPRQHSFHPRRSDRPDAFDAAGKGRLSGTGGRYTSWRKPGNHCQSRRPSGF